MSSDDTGGPAELPVLIHHLAVFAADQAASERFYSAALAPLGVTVGYLDAEAAVAEFWYRSNDATSLSVERAPGPGDVTRGLHVAFTAADRTAVDAFYAAALDAGGVSRHAPRHWPEYRAYCAFVSDPDGNNVEAVHKET